MTPTGVDTPAPAKPPSAQPRVVEDAQQGPPPAYDQPELVKRLVRRCIEDAANNPARLERDMSDIYNLKFHRGGAANQWIYRPRNSASWEELPFDGDEGYPAWFPRCVTNDFANRIDGISSIFSQSDAAKIVTPATDDDSDLAAADVAQRGLPVIEDEIGWSAIKRDIAHLCALTNGIALVLYYDNDPKHGTSELPVYQCLDCAEDPASEFGGLLEATELNPEDGTCPHCGGAALDLAPDPERPGQKLTLNYARGKLCADLVNSFGYSLPRGATSHDAQKNPWVLLHNKFEPDTAARMWPEHAKLIRDGGEKSSAKNSSTNQLAEELRNLSSPNSSPSASGSGAGKGGPVLIYRLQHDPITDGELHFPDGLYAVMFGDHVLESGPLPIEDSRTGQRRKTILTHTFRAMPGSPFGKPPADDLAPIQVQLNLLEALAFLTTMHHASPTVYLPDTVTLIDEPTGRPGQTVRFRDHGTGKGPITAQGSGVHPTVFQQMDRYEAKMDKLSGLNAVLQGARPEKTGGAPTLGEVQILQERGMASFKTPLDGFVDFQREVAILGLDFARQCMWSPRFRKIKGDNGQWEVEQFLGADLTGNVDIRIDPMSAWPKSPMMQDLRLKSAVELGILSPAQDPEVAGKALDDWGLGDFKKSLSVDRKQIARELDRWRAATDPSQIPPPDLAAIEPGIHLFVKRQFLKTEQAEQIRTENQPVYQAMLQHVQMLQQALAPPPTAAPGDGAPAGPDNAAVDAAVASGALVPEGAGGDPLEAAVAAGALQPEGAMPQGPTGPSMDQLLEAQLLVPAGQEPAAP